MQLQLFFEQENTEIESELGNLVDMTARAVEQAICASLEQECYNVIVASEDLIRQLNRDYRQQDSVTDVLSFPLGPGDEVTGEIYICWARIISQSEEYCHSWQREFCFLLVHGILHLLGYEHGDLPNPEMRAMEEKILAIQKLGRA